MHATIEQPQFVAAERLIAAAVIGLAVAGGTGFAGGPVVGLEIDDGVVLKALLFKLIEQ